MAFLLISQAQGVSGKNEQSSQTPWRGAPEARGPMQLHRLHRLKAGPGCDLTPPTRAQTSVWAGMQWLDGKWPVNIVFIQHSPKLSHLCHYGCGTLSQQSILAIQHPGQYRTCKFRKRWRTWREVSKNEMETLSCVSSDIVARRFLYVGCRI